MTERALFRYGIGGFKAANPEAERFEQGVKLGEVVELRPVRIRNGKYHRLFFVMLKLISENSEPEITEDEALYFAKIATGTGKWIADTKGREHFVPGSISFAKMKQDDFKAFVQAAIPPLCKRFLHGTAPEEVIQQAMSLARGE